MAFLVKAEGDLWHTVILFSFLGVWEHLNGVSFHRQISSVKESDLAQWRNIQRFLGELTTEMTTWQTVRFIPRIILWELSVCDRDTGIIHIYVFIQHQDRDESSDQPVPPFLWKVIRTLICHVTFSVRIDTSLPSGNHLRETSVGGSTSPLVIPPTGGREKVPSCFHRRLINWRCWEEGTYNTS